MRTALDAPSEALDPVEKNFVAKIREYGFFRTEVGADGEAPGFSYTTGVWINTGHPEMIMFGMKGDIAHDVFWDLFRNARTDVFLPIGRRTDQVFANSDAYAFAVAEKYYGDYLGWSRWFYGRENFTCVQIVWPDPAGLFPWEAGFAQRFADDQPDLTENGWFASIVE